MRLLIAEDERDLAEALTVFFEKNQFSVDAVYTGTDAYDYAKSAEYDAVILDIMMPGLDGIEILRRLRDDGIKTPIMLLTAKGEKQDRILGFDSGADDYLPKPFEPDELISRVRAMLRRSEAYQPSVLSCGDVALDPSTGLLSCGGQSLRLSGREFQVLELFLRNPRQVFSAERIMERVWAAMLRQGGRAPERQRVSAHGAVFALSAHRFFRRPHNGACLGLGQRCGDQCCLGASFQFTQKIKSDRFGRLDPCQPRAWICFGGDK